MKPKYNSVEYFELLDLEIRISADKYNKFGLANLDKLRFEVKNKIAAIELSSKNSKKLNREKI